MKTDDYYFNPIIKNLQNNLSEIKRISGGSSDLLINEFTTGGIKCALLCCEGMLATSTITELVLHPITKITDCFFQLTVLPLKITVTFSEQ